MNYEKSLKRSLFFCLLILLSAIAYGQSPTGTSRKSAAPENVATNVAQTTKKSKTKVLFNGKDLDGWEIINNGQFSVKDGLLKLNRGLGWLRSEDTFDDYKLTMEFRFTEAGSNSGIFIRTGPTSKEGEAGWPDNGIQIQTIDSVKYIHHLGMIIPYGAPPFEFVSSREAATSVYKPAGNWHTYEIECVGEIIKVRLNGTLVGIAVGVKNSDGHIGIQGEHGLLEFRKIEIEEF